VKRIIKSSPWLLEVICGIVLNTLSLTGVRKAVGFSSISPLMLAGAEKWISFITAIILETADSVAFDDIKMRGVYIYLMEGLKVSNNLIFTEEQKRVLLDWKCSCCLILTQLSRKTIFADQLKSVLSNALSESLKKCSSFHDVTGNSNMEVTLLTSLLTTASILAERGRLEYTMKLIKTFGHLSGWKSAVETTEAEIEEESTNLFMEFISANKEIASSLSYQLLSKLVELLTSMKSQSEEDSNEDFLSLIEFLISQLIREENTIPKNIIAFSLKSLLSSSASSSSSIDAIRNVCKSIYQRFPRIFDETVTELYHELHQKEKENPNSENNTDRLTTFLGDLFQNSEFSSSFDLTSSSSSSSALSLDNLYLSLNSPIKQIRCEAIKRISKYDFTTVEKTEDSLSLIRSLFLCCEDIDYDIALAVWNKKILRIFISFLSSVEIYTVLSSSLQWWFTTMNEITVERNINVITKILSSLNDNEIYSFLFLSLENIEEKNHENSFFFWIFSFLIGNIPFSQLISNKLQIKLKKTCFELFCLSSFVSSNKKLLILLSNEHNALKSSPEIKSLLIECIEVDLKKKKSKSSSIEDSFLLNSILSSSILYDDNSNDSSNNNTFSFFHFSIFSFLIELAKANNKNSIYDENQHLLIIKRLLKVGNTLLVSSTGDSDTDQQLATMIRGLFEVCQKNHSSISDYNIKDFLFHQSTILENDEVLQLKIKFFLSLCLSNNVTLLEIIDVCLVSFFSYNYLLVLLLILVNLKSIASEWFAEENLSSIETIIYKIIVLSMENILNQDNDINGPDKKKKKNSMSSERIILSTCCIPLLLWGSSHTVPAVRQLTIKASEIIANSSSPNDDDIISIGDIKDSENIVVPLIPPESFHLQFSSCKQLASLIITKSSVLLLQGESTSSLSLLVDGVEGTLSAKDVQLFVTHLWKLLTLVFPCSLASGDHPFVSVLLSVLKGFDLNENLSYLLSVFKIFLYSSSSSVSLDALFHILKSSVSSLNAKNQSVIVEFIEDIISDKGNKKKNADSRNRNELKNSFLSFIADGSLKSIQNDKIKKLSQLLFHQYLEQSTSSSSNLVINALASLSLDLDIFITELSSQYEKYQKIINDRRKKQSRNNKKKDVDEMDHDSAEEEEEMDDEVDGKLLNIINQVTLVLELYLRKFSVFDWKNVADSSSFFQMVTLLFNFLSMMKECGSDFLLLNNVFSSAAIEYLSTVVLECIYLHIAYYYQEGNGLVGSSSSSSSSSSKSRKSLGKASSSNSADDMYNNGENVDRILVDINFILESLSFFNSYQFQLYAFKIIHLFVASSSSSSIGKVAFDKTISLLGTIHNFSQFEGFLGNILDVRKAYLKKERNVDESDIALLTMQSITQAIASFLFSTSETDNLIEKQTVLRQLMKLVLSEKGEEEEEEEIFFLSMFISFLCYIVSSYEKESSSVQKSSSSSMLSSSLSSSVDTICLSRAAEKRAKRVIISSLPEQIYQLTHFLFFHMSSSQQIPLLTTLLNWIQKYFLFSVNDNNNEKNQDSFILSSLTYLKQVLHPTVEEEEEFSRIVSNLEETEKDEKKSKKKQTNTPVASNTNEKEMILFQGYSSTITILSIEFILEILENRKFHRNLLKSLSKNDLKLQPFLLTFTDHFLQLIVSIEQLRNYYGKLQGKVNNNVGFSQTAVVKGGKQQKIEEISLNKILLRLENQHYYISKYSFSNILFDHILNCITSFQGLLDLPSFIIIIQELLDHNSLLVRQRAIHILKDRLQESFSPGLTSMKNVDVSYALSYFLRFLTLFLSFFFFFFFLFFFPVIVGSLL
jgi:hypothetical protein